MFQRKINFRNSKVHLNKNKPKKFSSWAISIYYDIEYGGPGRIDKECNRTLCSLQFFLFQCFWIYFGAVIHLE